MEEPIYYQIVVKLKNKNYKFWIFDFIIAIWQLISEVSHNTHVSFDRLTLSHWEIRQFTMQELSSILTSKQCLQLFPHQVSIRHGRHLMNNVFMHLHHNVVSNVIRLFENDVNFLMNFFVRNLLFLLGYNCIFMWVMSKFFEYFKCR